MSAPKDPHMTTEAKLLQHDNPTSGSTQNGREHASQGETLRERYERLDEKAGAILAKIRARKGAV